MCKRIIYIKKRGGARKEKFEARKIYCAVMRAMKQGEGQVRDLAWLIAKDVKTKIKDISIYSDKDEFEIEEIQDMVENLLIKYGQIETAKHYIKYREKRKNIREAKHDVFKQVDDIFTMKSEEVRNNANKAGDKIQTYRAMIADVTCNAYADSRVIPSHLLEEHGKSIYIHDKSYIAIPFFNCILVNWIDMLDNGFHMSGTEIRSPKSIATAVALLSQIIAHTSSNTYGGNTISNLDLGLEKYAKLSYDKHLERAEKWIDDKERCHEYAWEMLTKEVYDCMQSLEYEITTLMNSRGEQPFLTVTYGLGSSKFARLIQKAHLETRKKGFTDGNTPVFPKIGFFLKKGLNLNEGDPNYDIFKLAVSTSAKRMYPDYLNCDKLIEVTGDIKSPMGCRSFLSTYIDENGNIITDGRFNQGVCSINLTRIAIESKGDSCLFYELLNKSLELATEVLMLRHKLLKGLKAKQAPILYSSGAVSRLNPEDTIDHLLENGYSTLSIGYVGLYNAVKFLCGKSFDESTKGEEKAQEIMLYLKNYANDLKKKTNLGFSLYGTPAEVLATKFCKQDVKDFGIIEGVNDKGYYENSFHFPSDTDITPFDKIEIESKLSRYSSGGAIQYVEFGDITKNEEALEQIIRFAYDKCHYFGVNVKHDKCHACGFEGEILNVNETENDYKCPQCDNTDKSKMAVVRRLCGYLSALSERPTVDGKMKEIHGRVEHFK